MSVQLEKRRRVRREAGRANPVARTQRVPRGPSADSPDRPSGSWWNLLRGLIDRRPRPLPQNRWTRFLLLACASFLPYLAIGQTWLVLGWLGRQAAAGTRLPRPDFSGVATVPGRLVAFHFLFLLCYWLPRPWSLRMGAVGALGLGLGLGMLDLPSLVVLFALALGMYGLFHLRIPRWSMLATIAVAVMGVRYAAHTWEIKALNTPGLVVGLLVVLWYACYQVTTGKPMPLSQYLGYTHTRLFMEGPVFTPQEFAPAPADQADEIRLGGIRALISAMVCKTLAHHISLFLAARDWKASTGLTLLGYSYLNYLAVCFGVVFSYNLMLGVLRLFGLPVRDNFAAWILARTPNEHWRRWNLLFREWLVTFTFFPMMRARINLFTCVMVTLLASGVIHVAAHASGGAMQASDGVLTMGYWAVNGLLIFVVVDFPRRFPQFAEKIKLEESPIWSVIGWVLTSALYAVLFYLNRECETLSEVPAYFARLFGMGG